jgi:hypothetical protein
VRPSLSHFRSQRCLVFDIAKDGIAVGDGRGVQFIANRRKAIRRFLRTCRADFAVCEPTGGYETLLLEECLRLELPAHCVDTRRLKGFIRSHGQIGKSDAIDARGLAAYGMERWASLALWQAADPCQEGAEGAGAPQRRSGRYPPCRQVRGEASSPPSTNASSPPERSPSSPIAASCEIIVTLNARLRDAEIQQS